MYGGKSAGHDYWLHLQTCMEFIGFKFCTADADIWMSEALKSDGTNYWEYIPLYTDDCLAVSVNP